MKVRFETARARYQDLCAYVDASVARYEWAKSACYSHHPYGIERHGFKRGRVMRAEPKTKSGTYRYALTADERILVEEQNLSYPTQKYEEFWEHSSDRIDSTRFDYFAPEKRVINVEATLFSGGLPQGFIRYAQHGLCVEAYEYEQGLLVRSFRAGREHDPKSRKHAWNVSRFEYEHSGEQLTKITQIWESGEAEEVFP